ncbi:MAG: VapB-type antitoxin [Candidatus Bathyarchaeia archaeon]
MAETTTIRVSKSTLKMLEKLRQKLGVQTLDETIRLFIVQQRRQRLSEVFGIDKGKIKPFTEEDRGENGGNSGSSC